MKKTIGLLALCMTTVGANAATTVDLSQLSQTNPGTVQMDLSGNFSNVAGSISSGAAFTSRFTFNLMQPNGSILEGTYPNRVLKLDYWQNAQASVDASNQHAESTHDELNFWDNHLGVTEAEIDRNGFTGLVTADIYDFVALSGSSADVQFDSVTDELTQGTEFSMIALFDKDTFVIDPNTPLNYADIFSANPIFLGFQLQKVTNGIEDFRAAGELSSLTISSVPLPASVWLFGSAIAGIGFRLRKRA
ncbi:hypothetical protein A1359_09835 [Methylomonas lenta]|uniref:Ice-binding protein C-terminal domain-containing protein n=1 Tax=Methylomonas lenta TaxID=980561 RepID=A0A177NAV9_9GAMM|nr:VPLPA-CTERM sorting domain-containing protein [Methylomonas lenta]OAI15005.1 hypothetical protein A1359_09835 [Methylomonas lenta]